MEFNSYHVLQLLLCELAEEVPLEFQRGIAQTPPEFLTAAPLLWHSSQCLNIQEGVSKNWTLHSATEIRTWALIRDKLLFCRGRQKLLALPTHDINNGQKRMSVPVVCVWVCCFVRCVCVCVLTTPIKPHSEQVELNEYIPPPNQGIFLTWLFFLHFRTK